MKMNSNNFNFERVFTGRFMFALLPAFVSIAFLRSFCELSISYMRTFCPGGMKKHCYNVEASADPPRKSHAGTARQPRRRVCATSLYGRGLYVRVCTHGSVHAGLYDALVRAYQIVRRNLYAQACTHARSNGRASRTT